MVVHGGAGTWDPENHPAALGGLSAALAAGSSVLAKDGVAGMIEFPDSLPMALGPAPPSASCPTWKQHWPRLSWRKAGGLKKAVDKFGPEVASRGFADPQLLYVGEELPGDDYVSMAVLLLLSGLWAAARWTAFPS